MLVNKNRTICLMIMFIFQITSAERTTYIEIDERYSTNGIYSICSGINTDITTCQEIYPEHTSLCDGGYKKDITNVPVITDERITICCSVSGGTNMYANATNFLQYLRDKDISSLATIGCDFGDERQLLKLSTFEFLKVRSPSGENKFEIDMEDTSTQIWVSKLMIPLTSSELHVDGRVFSHSDSSGNKVKSFSFYNTNDGDMKTITYLND